MEQRSNFRFRGRNGEHWRALIDCRLNNKELSCVRKKRMAAPYHHASHEWPSCAKPSFR
jgi:hypothetical protein